MLAIALATARTLNVIDPCNRTGKIVVPMEVVSETKGVNDFLGYGSNPPADAKDLSLCLLFQKSRCHAGARCNQVHAAPDFIDQLRTEAQAAKSCCARHGDMHSTQLAGSRTVVVQADEGNRCFALADFAFTEALDVAMKRVRGHGPIRVQATRICRLHQRGSCKFGRDCKNIHLCFAATAHVEPPAAAAARPLGIVGIPSVCDSGIASCSRSCSTGYTPVVRGCEAVKHLTLSVLSFEAEFQSMRADDPLDLIDAESSYSSLSAGDFDAFVDALVEHPLLPMASPVWITAPQ